jgi:hypothetical protein
MSLHILLCDEVLWYFNLCESKSFEFKFKFESNEFVIYKEI